MAKGQVNQSKNNQPKLTAKEKAAKPGKRGQRSVKKAKVVYDQARVDLLASL